MTLQLIFLSIVLFFSPLAPNVLGPLWYSLTWALLIQKANPRILIILIIWIGLLTNTIIRIVQDYVINRLNLYRKTKKNIITDMLNKVCNYFDEKTKNVKIWLKKESKIGNKTGKFFIFLFAIFCFLPIIPDIVSNRLLYKKIKFPYFILAVLIGKSIIHIPFVFFWKWLVSLLKI